MQRKRLIYTLRDCYEKIKKEEGIDLKWLEYRDLMRDFLEEIGKAIIRENYVFKMPFYLGWLRISKKERKTGGRRYIDWANTKKYNKKIFHRNLHTDGNYFRWHWQKSDYKAMFKNSYFYNFTPVRDAHKKEIGKRGLAAWIKKCANDAFKKDYNAVLVG